MRHPLSYNVMMELYSMRNKAQNYDLFDHQVGEVLDIHRHQEFLEMVEFKLSCSRWSENRNLFGSQVMRPLGSI